MTFIEARYHGGSCCGMSHILNFPSGGPNTVCDAVERQTFPERQEEQNEFVGLRFNYTRPRETAKERLIAVIRALSVASDTNGFGWNHRTSGILEVVLTSSQKNVWGETLKELGFKEINSCYNSNSGRILHVFHNNTGTGAQ